MKNIFKLFGIIAFMAVIGFSMAACGGGGDDDEDDLNNPNGPNVPNGPGSGTGWAAVTTTIFDDQVIEYNGTKYTLRFDINAIAYGNNKFVAGSENGKMAYSSDGKTWTAVSNSTFGTSDINAIAYGNGKFVAGGENGKMATSTDGVNWTAVSDSKFGTNNAINAIAFGNGKFVAGGGYIAYSSDNGASWDRATGTYNIDAIGFGNGKFVAGGGGALSGNMKTSPDGITWTNVSNSKVTSVAWGNNTFIAGSWGGGMQYLTDNGVTWIDVDCKLDKDSAVQAIAFGNNTFVAGCYDDTSYSTDNGATWTPVRNIGFSIYAIAFGNGTFVAVGRNGGIAYSTGFGSGGTNPGTGGAAPTITTTALSNGTVGTVYTQILTATSDTPITWTISSGTLPVGLSLAPATGVISGTPTTAGTSTFTVKATNAKGNVTKTLSITIATSGGTNPGTGGSGTLTITDIPAIYNGKYAFCIVVNTAGTEAAIGVLNWQTESLPLISNRRVSIPLWTPNNTNTSFVRFSGNGTFSVLFDISDSEDEDEDPLVDVIFPSVNFSGGSATVSWNNATSIW